jgi:type I restriction enzyme R subunit
MQSEAILEKELITQLVGMGYASVKIYDGAVFLTNLKTQLEAFNKATFTTKEFNSILNHLEKGNVFDKAKTLRDRFALQKESGDIFYVRFFNSENWLQNRFQVTNQVQQEGSFLNRYDVTILVNGLPLVQIELKRRGMEIKEAFNQINRYQKHSFWSNHGLFQYVQMFIISNGANTKYLANNPLQSVLQTYYWANEKNKIVTDVHEFARQFLNTDHLGKMISHYIVFNETFKTLMVLRPYQYYATEAIVKQVETNNGNGYIWHTTGSGKTLTSFKTSQIIMDLPEVHKVIFVVDRKDLDYQTMREFNNFKEDSVDVTDNTSTLVKQLTGDTKLVLTTIQKLNNAITKTHYESKLSHLANKKLIFIFDECHRSQFGLVHDRIIKYFKNCQLFGFTGTPIFAVNASKNELGKRTTTDLFGQCLHKYVITDAIQDQNVLRFGIEYVGRYRQKGNTLVDIEVEDIDRPEVLNSDQRLDKITDYIINYHDQKTYSKNYSALFAVSSIETLIKYYDIFRKKKDEGKHNLRIATIFTYGTNEDDEDAQDYIPDDEITKAEEARPAYISSHTRDKLEAYIGDYNKMYGQNFTTKDSQQFQNYFVDLTRRLKDREKPTFNDEMDRLDLVIVVNMLLTGFDAKKVNTLYVDKNLKYHGLIQAYSRTNRIMGEQKSQGNILSFRNLKKSTDEAITLFSNRDAIDKVVMPPVEVIAGKFDEALKNLLAITPTYQSVDDLVGEEEEMAFIQAFRTLLRVKNVLASYTDFSWDNLGIDEETFNNYKSKYLDLYDKVRNQNLKQKTSILNDIDFEVELIHRDQINVAYILKLLAKLKQAKTSEAQKQKKAIIDLLGGEIQLRSKRELIEKFIEEHLPKITDADLITDEFERYWEEQKVLALAKLCDDEHLDREQFKALIEAYIFSGREPLRDEVLRCLGDRPSILKAREIGDRIIAKMKEYVQVFERGMVA